MADRYTALVHHFPKRAVTQGIGGVLANADQNHIDLKRHHLGVQHGHSLVFKSRSLAHADNQPFNATESLYFCNRY